jgi:hypothetical protein
MRATLRSQTRLKTHAGGGCSHPAVRSVWAIAADGKANGVCFGLIVGHGCIDYIRPIRWSDEILDGELRRGIGTRRWNANARARPVLRTRHQAGAKGISLDVSDDRKQMPVVLDRERLETTLPHVTAMAVMLQVSPHVRRHQPLHPARQVSIPMGHDNQVKMVPHQAVGYKPHRYSQRRLTHRLEEGAVIRRLVENLGPRASSIQHMLKIPSVA